MSLLAPYVDGELQTSTTSSDSLGAVKTSNSAVDSDTFLTLLVAEMQNQDPLEPTSNTEWVSQYATFTQVQQMSEMADAMDVLRANTLIGKEVIMKVTSQTTGETSYKRGVVDYVVIEEGKALLNIGGANYSMDDLDTVASDDYFEAYDFYQEFTGKIDALPSVNLLDKSYKNAMESLYEMYTNMTESQKEYMEAYAPDYLTKYNSYIEKMADMNISFETDAETVKEATMEDLLAAFNEKMEALMSQISNISSSSDSSTTTTSDSQSSTQTTETSTETTTETTTQTSQVETT